MDSYLFFLHFIEFWGITIVDMLMRLLLTPYPLSEHAVTGIEKRNKRVRELRI